MIVTLPELAFAINKLSQFMHKTLKYLKHSLNLCLKLIKPPNLKLQAYSGADWGRRQSDLVARSSTEA
ncbi:hypothetical protein CR513_12650, partial [Mucuna pruriens]